MQGKKWYKSKEMWSAITLFVGGLAAFATGEQSLQELLISVVGLVFGILRVQTYQPIIKQKRYNQMKQEIKVNIAFLAVILTASLFLISAISGIRKDISKNTGDIQAMQVDMGWVKNAIQDANNGDLSYVDNPIMRLFVKK